MKPTTINEYIAGFPPAIRTVLRKIRSTVRHAAPGAQERISYGIPCFSQDGNLVYFAAFKHHIGFFPPVSGDESYEMRYRSTPGRKETSDFRSTNRFPMP